jgi:hypothetical protein
MLDDLIDNNIEFEVPIMMDLDDGKNKKNVGTIEFSKFKVHSIPSFLDYVMSVKLNFFIIKFWKQY